MELQQKQLDQLAEWLAQMEQLIAEHPEVGPDLESIKKQITAHKVLYVTTHY